jgi:hypothetical protein
MKNIKNIFDGLTILSYTILLILSIINKNWDATTGWFCACLLMIRIKLEEYYN